ncbi:MAG: DUF1801 domain-containing protein [Chloroflexi bacterium]|nr:MAG: DUF1801 domain-containing protein [Chloroflexota bacterium]
MLRDGVDETEQFWRSTTAATVLTFRPSSDSTMEDAMTALKTSPGSSKTKAATIYIAKQSADQRALLERLHAIVIEAIPNATTTIKWGVPFYQVNGKNVCALASFKEHVGINFFAPPAALADPGKKLEGSGKSNRMLKVRNTADLDKAAIRRWLKAAATA